MVQAWGRTSRRYQHKHGSGLMVRFRFCKRLQIWLQPMRPTGSISYACSCSCSSGSQKQGSPRTSWCTSCLSFDSCQARLLSQLSGTGAGAGAESPHGFAHLQSTGLTMATGAVEVLLGLILGLPVLLLAWILAYSLSLHRQAARHGVGAQLPGRFWQLPLVGESIPFFSAALPDDFLLPRIKRYGPVFRTHIMGRPTVCVTSAETVKLVLQSPRSFPIGYPNTARELFGRLSVVVQEGEEHSRLRRIIDAPLFPEALKRFPQEVDCIARRCLEEWGSASGEVINCERELKKFAFYVSLKINCDSLTTAEIGDLLASFTKFAPGFTAIPLTLPGTTYKNAVTARKKVSAILEKVIEKRQAEQGSAHHNDLLQGFLSWEKNSQRFDKRQVADNMLTVLLASHDTFAGTVTLLIRNLCLYPSFCQEVKEEQDAIARAKASASDPLTWDDLRQMHVTMRFLNETFRLDNPTSVTSRETHEDVMLDGMLIPKGWQVLVWPSMFHHSSQWYPDPYKFDPSRFNTKPHPSTFTPFGYGHHICPGRELARLEILVFLHRFLTTYEFEPAGPIDTRTRSYPIAHPVDGMPVKIKKRSS